ncbi:sugar phosphate isomerase/epimerase [Actinosynnema sp. NPDC023794]
MTARRLTVSSLTLGDAPFGERVRVAAEAGFGGVGLSVEVYQSALRSGLDDEAMRAILAEHGVAVTEVEFLSDWVATADTVPPTPKETTAFHIARAFGADHVNAGLFETTPLDALADGFTALCERAGEVKVALEYMPFAAVPDLGTAWEVVRGTGRANAGLVIDVWHWVRGGTEPAELDTVPADRVFAVQLCDISAEALVDMRHESLHHRLPPGSRTRHAQDVVAILERHGVTAELSAEVMSDALLAQGFDVTAKAVFAGMKHVLDGR